MVFAPLRGVHAPMWTKTPQLSTGVAILVRCVCPARPLRAGASACSFRCRHVKFELCSHSSTTLSCGAPWGGYPVVWGAAGRSCGQICGRCGHRADVAPSSTTTYVRCGDTPTHHRNVDRCDPGCSAEAYGCVLERGTWPGVCGAARGAWRGRCCPRSCFSWGICHLAVPRSLFRGRGSFAGARSGRMWAAHQRREFYLTEFWSDLNPARWTHASVSTSYRAFW